MVFVFVIVDGDMMIVVCQLMDALPIVLDMDNVSTEHVLVTRDLLDNFVMRSHLSASEIVLVMVFAMKVHVFVYLVFGMVTHVTLKSMLVLPA